MGVENSQIVRVEAPAALVIGRTRVYPLDDGLWLAEVDGVVLEGSYPTQEAAEHAVAVAQETASW